MYVEIIKTAIGGGLGAIIKDILEDGHLVLPENKDGKLYLGCIGGLIIGAVAGYFIDGSFVTAFMGGYVGKSVIENLMARNGQNVNINIKRNGSESV